MIKRIKWDNYNALGDLELNFSKPDGTIFNTIILAGENGTGKTTILDTLASYLNKDTIMPFDYIEYVVDRGNYIITPDKKYGQLGFHTRKSVDTSHTETVRSGRNNNEGAIDSDEKDLRHFGFAYSRARSGFRTEHVLSATTQQVDNEKYEPDSQDNFTRIKQLLIDIDAQDASEWKKCSEAGGLSDHKYAEFKKGSKGYRFENAFNDFFDDIKYIGIDNNNPNEKQVLFEKHGHQIPVDYLSTGEKQIVFRGAHLLRNINSISKGIVLIDEPELSMHPIWQKEILKYYRGLFTKDGKQTVQMVIATHSEYIVQAALEDRDDVLVIVLTDDDGKITSRNITAPNVLPSVTAAETNYLAFGITSTDYHIELYGWLQTKNHLTNITACDNYIIQHRIYDNTKHEKIDNSYRGQQYRSLPTYIRNAIDHPDSGRIYTSRELKTSIELLIELCK